MKIIVAMDSFKGSLSSIEANAAVSRALVGHDVTSIPISDGGEGFLDAWLASKRGIVIEEDVTFLDGTTGRARYGWDESTRHAVIEVAETAGLTKVDHMDPWRYSSFGTGMQIVQALERGAERLTIGLGGSGTIDGGKGLLEALGVRFFDATGDVLSSIPHHLEKVVSIDWSGLHPGVARTEWVMASDVTNPLVGDHGASVFGSQKGLALEEVTRYEQILRSYAACFENSLADAVGAGAAGGIGFALLQLGAVYVSGIEEVIRWSGLDRKLRTTDWLITGEGKFDAQTLDGKAPYGLARLAHTLNVPTLVFSGQTDWTSHVETGIVGIFPIVSRVMTLEEAKWEAAPLLTSAVKRVFHVIENTSKR